MLGTARGNNETRDMLKNINEIKRDHIRLHTNELGIWLNVREINWVGPHEPVSYWTTVKRLGQPPATEERVEHSIITTPDDLTNWVVSPQEIEKAIDQLLANRRYFQICGRCRRLHPVGHMHDDFACQSCAEKNLGMVY